MEEQGRKVSLRDYLSTDPTVEEIQSLVGVFPQATTIDLASSNLGTWRVEHIAALKDVFPQATTINLGDNNLGTWSVDHVTSLSGIFPQATTIALGRNRLEAWRVNQIAALGSVFPQAAAIGLWNNNLGRWSVARIAALKGAFPQATTIDLNCNNLRAWSVDQITALKNIFPQATTINLGGNHLETWSVDHIAALEGAFPRATTIDLHCNYLGDGLCGAIINLYEQNKFMILAIKGLDDTFQPQIDTIVNARREKMKDKINHIRYLFIKHSNNVAPLVDEHILKIILSFCFNLGPPSISDIINYNNVCLDENKRLARATAGQGLFQRIARAIEGQGFFQNKQPEAVTVTAESTGEDNAPALLTQPLLDNRGQQETSSQWCCC